MTSCLGLDISTSCTGWTVADLSNNEIKKVTLGHIRLESADDLMKKADVVRREIEVIYKSYNIASVYVEENMQAFRPGASSAQTLVKLAKFNGIVSYITYQVTGIVPININVNQARKFLGISLKREKECGISTKDQVHAWVKAHSLLENYSWPHKVISSGPRKGTEVLENHVYDMSDAFVIALAGTLMSA